MYIYIYTHTHTTRKKFVADGLESKPSAENLFADGQAVGEERTSVKKIFANGQTVGEDPLC
jgi:regulatory protein YycH of two-component signal transduction system YycFG